MEGYWTEGYWTEGPRPSPDLKADLKKIRDQILKDTGGLGFGMSPITIQVSVEWFLWALERGYVTADGEATDKFGREVREADEEEERRGVANEVGSGI